MVIVIPSKHIYSNKAVTPIIDNKIGTISYEKTVIDYSSKSSDFETYIDNTMFGGTQTLLSDNDHDFILSAQITAKGVYDLYKNNSVYVALPIYTEIKDGNTYYVASYNQTFYLLPENNTNYFPETYISRHINIYKHNSSNTLYGKFTIKLKASKENPFYSNGIINIDITSSIFDIMAINGYNDNTKSINIYSGIKDKNETASIQINLESDEVYIKNTGSTSTAYSNVTLIDGNKRSITINAATVSLFSKSGLSYISKPTFSEDKTEINIDIYMYLIFANTVVLIDRGTYYEYKIKLVQQPVETMDMFVGCNVVSANANIVSREQQAIVHNAKDSVFEISTNELFNDTTVVGDKSIYDYINDSITAKYNNGKKTTVITCPITDYYDASGNKVIDIATSDKMFFQEGDIVIPYTYTNRGDKPMLYNKDFTPKQFKVVGTKISKNQGGMQELTLQEV